MRIRRNSGKIEDDLTYRCSIIDAKNSPENSVVDYLLWAVQRYILKGEERFFIALENKYNFIIDLYDDKASDNIYNSENQFRIEKIEKIK